MKDWQVLPGGRGQRRAAYRPSKPPRWDWLSRGFNSSRRSPRGFCSGDWLQVLWQVAPFVVVAVALIGYTGYSLATSPWPWQITLRHMAAAPNCDAARSVGLAPARRGEPGYYGGHDRDGDGVACEVWHGR